MSLLWETGGYANGGSPLVDFYSYNNDSGIWTTYSGWPDAVIVGTSSANRCQGAFDGTYWYVIGSDLKLYRMNGTTRVWSAALNGGVAPIGGNVNVNSWQMCCDGKFIYTLFNGNDFRRYDPVADAFTVLAAPPLGTVPAAAQAFLAYDGVDAIYARGTDAGTARQVLKYSISTATWSSLATFTMASTPVWVGATCLQGKLWVLWYDNVNWTAWAYDPTGPTWTQKSQVASGNAISGNVPYGEDTDSTIRVWVSTNSRVYNVGTDAWSLGSAPQVDFVATGRQGANWAITRIFSPQYNLFLADGVTVLPATDPLGTLVIGQVTSVQIQVQATVPRPSGAVVSVVSNVQTDAEDVVTVCATPTGVYTSGFTTGALSAGQFFSVYIQVAPSSQQTSGQTKLWNLRVT